MPIFNSTPDQGCQAAFPSRQSDVTTALVELGLTSTHSHPCCLICDTLRWVSKSLANMASIKAQKHVYEMSQYLKFNLGFRGHRRARKATKNQRVCVIDLLMQ